MSDAPTQKNTKYVNKWICFGVAIGGGIGVAMGSFTLAIGSGAAIGYAIGTIILMSRTQTINHKYE